MTNGHSSSQSDQSGHRAACELANMGFRVFPYYPLVGTACSCPSECRSPGKHPRIARYLDLATTDVKSIDAWWERWPNAGIGICPDNQLVLDIDGPSGHANLLEMQRSLGTELPPTFTCISGSSEPHHYHLYFNLPPGTRLLNKPLSRFKGMEAFHSIDVRSHRGQIAAPGTLHRDGRFYQWDFSGLYGALGKPDRVTDLPEAPAWLLSALGGLEVSESSQHCSVQGKPKEMPSRGYGDMNVPPESNDWYLKVIRERWPIVRAGQRNCLQVRPVTYLIAKGVPSDRIHEIMNAWLNEFDGRFNSSSQQAISELDDCIFRTQRDFKEGKIEAIADHSSKASSQEFHPNLEAFLQSNEPFKKLIIPEAEKHSNELSVSQLVDKTEWATGNRDLPFVLAVMLHYQYRVTQFGETETILMTHFQLQEILKNRFGQTVHRKQLYQLADQFISRKDQHGKEKRASVFELLKQTKRGYTGKPSDYRVTGLPPLA